MQVVCGHANVLYPRGLQAGRPLAPLTPRPVGTFLERSGVIVNGAPASTEVKVVAVKSRG